MQKIDWLECFVKARKKSVRCSNVQGGWRASGIYPLNSVKVLNKLPPSQDRVFEKINACEKAAKKKTPTGRPRKNAPVPLEVIVEEDKDEDEDLE